MFTFSFLKKHHEHEFLQLDSTHYCLFFTRKRSLTHTFCMDFTCLSTSWCMLWSPTPWNFALRWPIRLFDGVWPKSLRATSLLEPSHQQKALLACLENKSIGQNFRTGGCEQCLFIFQLSSGCWFSEWSVSIAVLDIAGRTRSLRCHPSPCPGTPPSPARLGEYISWQFLVIFCSYRTRAFFPDDISRFLSAKSTVSFLFYRAKWPISSLNKIFNNSYRCR